MLNLMVEWSLVANRVTMSSLDTVFSSMLKSRVQRLSFARCLVVQWSINSLRPSDANMRQ